MTDLFKPPDGFGRTESHRLHDRLSRRLRALTGVDEELLAWVWHERSKYTALGGVVLGTSAVAAFSMWNFANEAVGESTFLALLPAALWMLFVLNLDRWLIAPQPGLKRRAAPLLLRLVIAFFLGTVVAEPLVLRIFQTAVEEHVQDQRNAVVDRLRSDLLRCNADPSRPNRTPTADCSDHLLSFPASPASGYEEIGSLRKDAAALQKRVDRDTNRLEYLDAQVRDECRRLIRDMRTGLLQRTSECLRLREKARDYRTTHDTVANERRLAEMYQQIKDGGSRLAGSRDAFLEARDKEITRRVAQERAKQRGIGILERMQALEALAGKNATLLTGVWVVRLLFILVDVLPVLAKLLGSANSYDRLLSARSQSAVTIHEEAVRTAERQAMAASEIVREECEDRVRRHKAEIDADRREHVAAMHIRVSQAVNALEDEMRRSSSV
ncbi:DUF4407 domain-containing protein [Streptomyces paromomycinus]|uniref:DUF4407 domain-containing protein n=1 Tax=Streptomyces paromomycinus TaxID=92743 RepID=A0A401WD16_STREY|nr:DUF4407 domain-containing protein [Streptomyces paromomycinus]GCD47235.1 hypothetical protein GKJPGBOP_07001 [Streptomyces paromomycinus]